MTREVKNLKDQSQNDALFYIFYFGDFDKLIIIRKTYESSEKLQNILTYNNNHKY